MIFVTGDTHGSGLDMNKLTLKSFPEQKKLTKNDYVIICGDFGLVWDKSDRQAYYQEELNKKNFTTLWIDGNHENFDLINEYPVEEWNGGKVHKISHSIIHLMRGQVFTIEGKTFFTLGGAASIDKENRLPYISWWPEEVPSGAEMREAMANLETHNWKVDYILTHECSRDIAEKLYVHQVDLVTDRGLKEFFDLIEDICTYDRWFFGHHHIDKIIDEKHTALYQEIIKL